MPKNRLNKKQDLAIRCAYADLVGAREAKDQGDYLVHDWEAHEETIKDLEREFPFVTE